MYLMSGDLQFKRTRHFWRGTASPKFAISPWGQSKSSDGLLQGFKGLAPWLILDIFEGPSQLQRAPGDQPRVLIQLLPSSAFPSAQSCSPHSFRVLFLKAFLNETPPCKPPSPSLFPREPNLWNVPWTFVFLVFWFPFFMLTFDILFLNDL